MTAANPAGDTSQHTPPECRQVSVSYELLTEDHFAVLRLPDLDLMFDAESAYCLGVAFQAAARDIRADIRQLLLASIRNDAPAAAPGRDPACDRYRLPDGTWSCTRDGVTEPCGDCDGCRHIAAINRARDAAGRDPAGGAR